MSFKVKDFECRPCDHIAKDVYYRKGQEDTVKCPHCGETMTPMVCSPPFSMKKGPYEEFLG